MINSLNWQNRATDGLYTYIELVSNSRHILKNFQMSAVDTYTVSQILILIDCQRNKFLETNLRSYI